jgi:2-iminobutanoate/2-iminopropanoate deaminase
MKKVVFSPDAPLPIGPYSQAMQFGNIIFTSGQISLNADGVIAPDDVAGQTGFISGENYKDYSISERHE